MRIECVHGDITEQNVDAIVNAANSSLLGGGGVDGAVHRKGGDRILAECRRLRKNEYEHGLPTGQAVATTAGDLPARWVVHTVGPVHSESEDRTDLLRSCYHNCLAVADDLGAASVAFPLISAGVYGWPVEDAIDQALQTINTTQTSVALCRLVLFTKETHRLAQDRLIRL